MKKLPCMLICFLTVGLVAGARGGDDPGKMIKHTLDQVITVLRMKDLSADEKNRRVLEIVTPMFDFSRMAKLTLGRRYWPQMTEEQQKRFTDLFVKRLKDTYRDKLVMYTDQKVVYDPVKEIKGKACIPTWLVSGDNRISIIYKLYRPEDQWKVYDLEIQGVSLIRSYRSQFRQILQNGTIDDLLVKLEQPVDS